MLLKQRPLVASTQTFSSVSWPCGRILSYLFLYSLSSVGYKRNFWQSCLTFVVACLVDFHLRS